jgi:hypothetical protein
MGITRVEVFALGALFCLGCGKGAAPDPTAVLPPPPAGQGLQLKLSYDSPAGSETWKCNIADLPPTPDTFYHIHRAESRQGMASHHMNLNILTGDSATIDPGFYDCNELYAAHPSIMEESITFFASQQPEFDLTLPTGVVAAVPGGVRVLHELHVINASESETTAWAAVNAYTIPADQVTGRIWGFSQHDRNINIPPNSEHDEWTRCVMSADVQLLYMSSHTHALGKLFSVKQFDGTNTGDTIYTNTDWHAPKLLTFDPPMTIAKGTGFEFNCHFSNPNPVAVHWGETSHDEMCQMIIAFTPGDQSIECKVVAASDGILSTEPVPGS